MKPMLFALLSLVIAGKAGCAPCEKVAFEAVESLTVQQVGQLANSQAEFVSGFAVVLQGFDSENRPRRGGLQAVAFLLVGTGDIDEQPVGALIWSSDAVEVRLEKIGDTGIKVVAAGARECTSTGVEILVQADGVVLAGNQKLGHLH